MLFARQYQPASSASGSDAIQMDDGRLGIAVGRGLERSWAPMVLTYPKQTVSEGDSAMSREQLLERIVRQSLEICNDSWPYHRDSLAAHPLNDEGGSVLMVGMVKGRIPVTVRLHIKMFVADSAHDAKG